MNGLWHLAGEFNIALAAVYAAMLAFWLALPAHGDTRVALVIGNATYANTGPLTNSRNDARAVAAKLTSIGFEVALYEDLDGQSFRVALGEFSEKALNADLALVYYAGHGIEMQGKNYLIPVDAKMKSESTAQFETVPLEQVIGAVREAHVLGMVMLDACRNNPFAATMLRRGSMRAVSRGLAPVSVEGETGIVVSFAAEAGQTADDGDGDHSPYATALLEVLDQPGLEVGRMFRSVRAKVKAATKGAQVPIEQMQLPDDEIYLVAAPAAIANVTKTAPADDPMVIYLAAVRSGDPAQLESYLARFPTHEMANQARQILLDYADDDLWTATLSRNTPRDYRVYLMAFPSGRHLAEAQAKIDAFNTPPPPAPPPEPKFELFPSLDLVGGDQTTMGLRGVNLTECKTACAADAACVAYTYVLAKEWCWTKSSVGTRESAVGIISALKFFDTPTADAPPAKPEPAAKVLTLYRDLDISGFDLTDAGIKFISLADCENWCRANTACTGFSYVVRKSWCWPKFGMGQTNTTAGIISGQWK